MAHDSVGGGDGAITLASWTAGHLGTALSFSKGTITNVAVPRTIYDGFSDTAYVEAWVYPTANPTLAGTIFRRRAAFNDWELSVSPSGRLYTTIAGYTGVGGTNGWNGIGVTAPSALPLNQWSKVSSWYDGLTLTLSVNDQPVGSTSMALPLVWDTPLCPTDTYYSNGCYYGTWIGSTSTYSRTQVSGSYTFGGRIDELRIATTPSGGSGGGGGSELGLRWTALGDSYSSGEGAGNYGSTDTKDVNQCHQSAFAWSSNAPGNNPDARVFPQSALRTMVACSGARSYELWEPRFFPRSESDPDCSPGEHCVAPQLADPSLANADFVSVTIGGNDTEDRLAESGLFGTVVMKCVGGLQNCAPPFVPDEWTQSLEDWACGQIDLLNGAADTPGSLRYTLGQIKQTSPNASVAVLLYPKLFVPDPIAQDCGNEGFDEQEMAWVNALSDDLRDVLACAAIDQGVRWVNVDFGDHAHCQTNSPELVWFTGVNYIATWRGRQESLHPNLLGQIAFANALRSVLPQGGTGGLPTPLNPPATECLPETPALATCGAARRTRTALPMHLGSLLLGSSVPGCGSLDEKFAPGQAVTIQGFGFEPGSAAALRIVGNSGSWNVSFGTFAADETGGLLASIELPLDAPVSGYGEVVVSGHRTDGEALILSQVLEFVPSVAIDSDSDGLPDVCDNCPGTGNADQLDEDADNWGSACDACPLDRDNDLDRDGTCAGLDPCPLDPLNDTDGDGICGESDLCPEVAIASCFFADGFDSGSTSKWSLQSP